MLSWQSQDDYYTSICSAATLQSDKKGFFQSFADHVTETAGPEWVKQFGSLQTDQEKINKCFHDKKIFEAVHGPLQNIQTLFRSKSGRIAQQRRIEGQRTAEKGKYERALQLLSQSVIRAPRAGCETSVDDGLSLAFALWERSAVLISLKEYQLALTDIQFAIKEKLPESYRAEAYYRMVECYMGMNEKTKALVALKIVSKLTENDFDWKKKIELKFKIIEEISPVEDAAKSKIRELPELTEGPNSGLPSTSNLLGLVSTEQAGRFVIAQQPIKAGDILAVEEPFAAALLPEKFNSHCLHCFKRLRAAIPCPECSGIAFCSDICRDTALKTYHRYECKFLDMLLGSGMSILCHISLRILTKTNLDYFLQLKPDLGTDTPQPYLRFYNLVSHKTIRTPTDFLHRTLMALFHLRVLQSTGYFGSHYDKVSLTEDEQFIGSLLLHQLQVLQFNAHEIYETVMKSPYHFQSTKLNYIAVGVYTSAAMFNHDCYPAVTRYFSGDKIILKAIRPVAAGEIVSENYGPIFTKKSLSERHRSLLSRYWFNCSCTACNENWPKYEELNEDIYIIRCHNKGCSGTIKTSIKTSSKSNVKCSVCRNEIKVEEMVLLIKSFVDDHARALTSMESGEIEKAVNLLCQYTNTVHSICRPPNKDLSLCQEALRSCWALEGTVYYIS
ncbi:protein-lysine N-methyltransferase SMYD4-like [Lycorma delicatula]|uniref:protein-lysine N-methyltransferase SMYD4-like n=1 Tax=Lycorma delicatula TaxID=130591 RepID=UPI003F516CF6